ncbi:MAG TPA: heavy metal-binding domain-containing protein [Lentimicrobium sp.]|nr:heavy metal-binding domain-containing protein [Lentimicrobium sp.]
MRKHTWLVTAILALFISLSSCNNAGNRNTTGNDRDTTQTDNYGLTEVIYTCPMHPEVTSDAPGQCPKCGMDLVKKEKHDHSEDSIADTVTL